MAVYSYPYKVTLEDIGHGNLCSNRAILSYLEDIATMHSEQLGRGMQPLFEKGVAFILLQWKLTVYERLPYGATFTVRTWARQYKHFYCYRDFEMVDTSGRLLAVASSKWSLWNTSTHQLEKLTEELLAPYEAEERGVYPEIELPKIKEPASMCPTYTCTIPRSFIDVNGHVHNLHYLTLAYEALPASVYATKEFDHVEIAYKKEMKLGDTVVCSYGEEKGIHTVCMHAKDDSTLHAIVKLY